MKNLVKKFENIYAAAAFAEAGEHETAIDIYRDEKRVQKRELPSQRPRRELRATGIEK